MHRTPSLGVDVRSCTEALQIVGKHAAEFVPCRQHGRGVVQGHSGSPETPTNFSSFVLGLLTPVYSTAYDYFCTYCNRGVT